MKLGALATRLRPHAVAIAIGAAAAAIAVTVVIVTVGFNRGTFGLPIEDSYIYLTYAKQFGRLEPFTYFSGSGYSAGSTSVLWPMLLAPFWTLGARGHALVWVSFGLCTVLYAWTCIGVYKLVRRIAGLGAGVLGAVVTLGTAPFAFTALSGMEVAFASALLVTALLLLDREGRHEAGRAPRSGPPSRRLAVCLAALALSRPEATIICGLIVGVSVLQRLRRRELRAAAWWMAPLVPMLAWLCANRAFAGHWFPNTGVVKSHFYLPGFDWTYWWDAVTDLTKQAAEGLFFDDGSPFTFPRLFAIAWLFGAARIIWWGARSDRRLLAVLIVASPLILVLAVIATSGEWKFHDYRYIAPAFPLFGATAACALAPIRIARWPSVWVARGHAAIAGALAAGYAIGSVPPVRDEVRHYAQQAADLERQVVTIGRYVHDKLPEASVMLHDAGAIAYYGDGPVYDMLGLVTNSQAQIANHGPGSRFEFLERLPADRRPTHFAYYPKWMGNYQFFGDVVLHTTLTGPTIGNRKMIGSGDMQLIEARWDHVHSAERPLEPHRGWHVVDRVDIADIEDEAAHHWSGDLGRRRFGDPTAKWSVVHIEVSAVNGLLVDGGRTIRGGREQFTVTIDPTKPVKLLVRTGGDREYDWNEALTQPAKLSISTQQGNGAEVIAPAPQDQLVELELELAHGAEPELEIEVTANRPYRVFHYFVLQPD